MQNLANECVAMFASRFTEKKLEEKNSAAKPIAS
jgi:hypothetical protein